MLAKRGMSVWRGMAGPHAKLEVSVQDASKDSEIGVGTIDYIESRQSN